MYPYTNNEVFSFRRPTTQSAAAVH